MQVELPPIVFSPPVVPGVSAVIVQRKEWDDALARAESLRTREADWDGQGASPPNPRHVDSCVLMLRAVRDEGRLAPPVFVTAAPDGAVCVEWHWAEVRLEAEIAADRVEWMLADGKGPAKFFETPLMAGDS